jgi:acyl carrier protein
MTLPTENDLVDLVINWVLEYKKEDGLRDGAITAETDLIANGLLDSYGMIDLLLFVETCVGCKIDLTDVDPAEFSLVRGVCRIALRNPQLEPSHATSQ